MRLISAAAVVVALTVVPAVGAPTREKAVAACPPGEVANPAGYGCIPALLGGAFVGAPSEEVLSACHGGNPYYCVDPYRIP